MLPCRSGSSLISLQLGEEIAHTLQAAIDLLGRGRVRQTNVVRASKGLAGNADHVCFAKQASCDVRGTVQTSATEKAAHVREDVERAVWLMTLDSGDRTKSFDDAATETDVIFAHFGDAGLRL